MTLGRKLITFGVLLTAVPMLAVGLAVFVSGRAVQQTASVGALTLARTDMDHIVGMALVSVKMAGAPSIAGRKTEAETAMKKGGEFTELSGRLINALMHWRQAA